MVVSKMKEADLTQQAIDKLLFEGLQDTGESIDCIIVLGSLKADKYRVPAAAKAYHAGRSRKVLLCGGKLREFPTGVCSEAAHMRKTALTLGIAEEDIILEASSVNTVENILYALVELQKNLGLHTVKKVLLVTTSYHMRRSIAIARYLSPKHISIIPCPADDTHTRRDNWMDTPEGTARAKGEATKIIEYVTEGIIPNFEI